MVFELGTNMPTWLTIALSLPEKQILYFYCFLDKGILAVSLKQVANFRLSHYTIFCWIVATIYKTRKTPFIALKFFQACILPKTNSTLR